MDGRQAAAFAASCATTVVCQAATSLVREDRTQTMTITHLAFDRLLQEATYDRWFEANLRCNRRLFLSLCSLLRSWGVNLAGATRHGHSGEKKLAAVLYFLASSGSYRSCAAAMGMSKALIVGVVERVIEALVRLLPVVVRLPQTASQWQALEDEFAHLCQIQGVAGTIDGSLIAIERPAGYEGF
ncbi:hypothetical protein PybrP1_008704 [[Pythium] brassicae (nom. inval.)]|nr:hypothetical protein PybrP1_008704 [[Pythium] brassicae (nom. inval.)]